MTEEVPRLYDPDPALFRRDFAAANRPAILVGVADIWPARKTWTLDYLSSRVGDAMIGVQVDGTGGQRTAAMRLDRYLDLLMRPDQDERTYAPGLDLNAIGGSLVADIGSLAAYMGMARYPDALRALMRDSPRLWIGPAGTVSPVHFDLAHNLFVQIVGRKRFTLFDPSQSSYLHYPDYDQRGVQFCAIDIEQPDLRRYPRFASARPIVVELAPGEILFLPHSWWHHVRSLDTSISLNTWWYAARMVVQQRSYWYHRLRREFLRAARPSAPR